MSDKAKIWLSPPHMGGEELRYVNEAFESNWIAPLGPLVNGFEDNLSSYCSVDHAAVLSSGTAAIHLALRILEIQKGDEIVVQSFTFCGSVNPVLYEGAVPVFVDSEALTWNLDPELLEETIKDRIKKKGVKPKAVIAVHLYGMPARIDEIVEVCLRYDIPLIEDAAEALGSTYKDQRLGSFGDFGIISFNGNKIITTSGGGALLSNSEYAIKKARFLSTQARDPAVHYEHSQLGFNYRMSNVLAGVGLGQLDTLDAHVEKRRLNHSFYEELLEDTEIRLHKEPSEDYFSNFWLTTALCREGTDIRDRIIDAFDAENIESRPLWKPMHMQPLFNGSTFYGEGMCEKLFENGICLPSGSSLSSEDKERISVTFRKVIGNV